MPALHFVSLIDEFYWVKTSLLAVFEPVLFIIVPQLSHILLHSPKRNIFNYLLDIKLLTKL